MSKFNRCEKEHGDIEGFARAVSIAGKNGQIARELGSDGPIELAKPITTIDLVTGSLKKVIQDRQVSYEQ